MSSTFTKIIDRICFLGDALTVNMNVMLTSNDNNGANRPFYNEYEYYSSSIRGHAVTIKRDFNYYLTIEKQLKGNVKSSVMIRLTDMFNFINCINSATEWFNKQNMFATDDSGRLHLIGEYTPIVITGLASDNFITLIPTVILSGDKYATGIQITLNDDVVSQVQIDKFMGMVYVLNKLDMFISAQAMVNSLNIEKGTNRHTFDERRMELPEPEAVIPSGRVISSKGSFFSKV